MKTSDFNYRLPEERIAQHPLQKRDASRLLVLNRVTGEVTHNIFNRLSGLLRSGDRLVFNDTKVFPARLWCLKESGARIELLFTRCSGLNQWEALAKPRRRLAAGMQVYIERNPAVKLRIDDLPPDGGVLVSTGACDCGLSIDAILEAFGEVPLPHYIKRPAAGCDRDRYQTVYARNKGAIAAPTAGLHFTDALLDNLKTQGVDCSYLTLMVGIGTFRPVEADDPRQHPMHTEAYELSKCAAQEIRATHNNGGRIIAVGTTVVRVLEHCAKEFGDVRASSGSTRLLILPGFDFKVIDGLITNFHLPRSTLLMLVCALAGRKKILSAYHEAVRAGYRFYSYGDAMLIH
ncbi:MAG: tRNA preQ1(34) S-adenosylmethionine ribosyltransferase-isomerase QueA [Chitinivibrionales bacterium]|nr:tRNA preQ1(34) S-adenosylmethionine ribosyltransferase-isomerase QueA [Chitinivibrionales bacterium]